MKESPCLQLSRLLPCKDVKKVKWERSWTAMPRCSHNKCLSWSLQNCPPLRQGCLAFVLQLTTSQTNLWIQAALGPESCHCAKQLSSAKSRYQSKTQPRADSFTHSQHPLEMKYYTKRKKSKMFCVHYYIMNSTVIYVWVCTKIGKGQKNELYYKMLY